METELQRKIDWLKKRHAEHTAIVEKLESDRQLNRSTTAQNQLRYAKKEKLRLKDMIASLENIK